MEPAVGLIYGSPRNVWLSKAGFRAFASLSSIVLVGLVSTWVAAVRNDPDYPITVDLHQAVFTDIQAALSVLYNTAELAFILLRSGHRGLHPGTSIVADLFLTVNLTLAILLPVMVCRQGWCTWEGTRRDFMPELGPWWTGGPTFAFSVLLAALHLCLLTFSCCEAAGKNQSAVRRVVNRRDDEDMALAGHLQQNHLDQRALQKNADLENYQEYGVESYPEEVVNNEKAGLAEK